MYEETLAGSPSERDIRQRAREYHRNGVRCRVFHAPTEGIAGGVYWTVRARTIKDFIKAFEVRRAKPPAWAVAKAKGQKELL